MHDVYQQMPGINISRLLALQESPAAFKYALDNPGPDSPAKALGRLVHTILLEPEKFHAGYVLKAYPDYRSKEAQTWKAAQEEAGRTIYTLEEFEQAEVMAANALDNPDIADLVGAADAIKEGAIQWRDKDTGVACKGRFDLLAGDVLADVKTTQDVTPTGFFRECLKYNTFLQDGVVSGWSGGAHRRTVCQSNPADSHKKQAAVFSGLLRSSTRAAGRRPAAIQVFASEIPGLFGPRLLAWHRGPRHSPTDSPNMVSTDNQFFNGCYLTKEFLDGNFIRIQPIQGSRPRQRRV